MSALARAFRIAVDRPRAAWWTTLALTCALLVVGAAGIAATAIDRAAAARPGSTATMVVYLGDGIAEPQARALAAQLAALPGVERAEPVAAPESARRLAAALGPDAALLDGVDPGVLPASIEVKLAPGVRDVVAISPTVRALRGTPGITDVIVDDPAQDRVAAALGHAGTVAWGVAAMIAALAAIIALAALRLRLERDRQELAVVALLGGGPAFTAIPTAVAGALHGVAAAALAIVGLAVAVAARGDAIAGAFALAPGAVALPGAGALLGFVAAGGALGLVAGALAGTARPGRPRLVEAPCVA